jgi:hypothetical protein
MKFNYEGHDKLGQIVRSSVEAETAEEAARIIRQDRGHYARDISTEEVNMRYEVPAIGGIAPLPKSAEESELEAEGYELEEDGYELEAEVKEPSQPTFLPKSVRLRTDLKADIESISIVLRQINEWKEAYRKASIGQVASTTTLPDGIPHVGGKTWEYYDKHFDAITEHLFKQALWSAVESESKR